jgi:hypothetical protein
MEVLRKKRSVCAVAAVFVQLSSPPTYADDHLPNSNTQSTRQIVSSSSPPPCLQAMDDRQLQVLSQIRKIASGSLSNEEAARTASKQLDELDLSPRQKQALTGLAAANFVSAREMKQLFDPKGTHASDVSKLIREGAIVSNLLFRQM